MPAGYKAYIRLSALIVIALFACTSFSQTTSKPRKKIKNFGSSLKRLHWDEEKKEAVLTQPAATANRIEEDVIRVETSLVAWDVLVLDKKGNNVQGLTRDDFQISENGVQQTVGHFILGNSKSVPRSIVLIIDYSGSELPYIRGSIDAAKTLVDSLAPLDQMAVVTDDVELLVDFTDNKELLKDKLESLIDRINGRGGFLGLGKGRQLGRSRQYSALMATLNEMFNESDQRPIVVFQTDGDELYRMRNSIVPPSIPPDLPTETRVLAEQSVMRRQVALVDEETIFTLADVYRTAEKSRATIYTVIPGYRLVGLSPEVQVERLRAMIERSRESMFAKYSAEQREKIIADVDQKWRPLSPANLKARALETYKVQLALAALATRTGGWTDYLETPDQASAIYSRIFSDINQRYIIGYYPTNKEHDGKRRTIKVTIKGHPEYMIIGRQSYYAPAN